MNQLIIEESNEYLDGKRINLQTVKSEYVKSDDMQTYANLNSKLAQQQMQVEGLTAMVADASPEDKLSIQIKMNMVKAEQETVKTEIDKYYKFIGGYDETV